MTDQKQRAYHTARAYSEWLVIRYQQGEKAAFDSLCSLWQQRFLLYAMRRLENRESAMDTTQEALLSMSRGLHRLSDPGAFPGWAFRILERRCADQLRKQMRDRQVFPDNADAAEDTAELAKKDNVENEISVNELMRVLDSRVRVVLQLHYLDGFTVNEVSEILGLPVGTIKSRLFYARKLLANSTNKKVKDNMTKEKVK